MTRRDVAALVLAAGLLACAGPRATRGTPTARPGWLGYSVRDLRFEAPGSWSAVASGDARVLTLSAPDRRARLEVSTPATAYGDERACLAAAAERIASGAGTLERARRHPTRLAGRPAQTLEADQGGWHVWALAACDGGVQYRIFLTAETPASPDALELWRALVQGARIGGEA